MALEDWSTTAGSNITIGGIDIAENCSPAGINNAIRELMAQIKTWSGTISAGSTKQNADATLTALAALVTSANKLIYATGSDTFATTDLTPFARTLLDDASASAARTTLGVPQAPTMSGTAASGYLTFYLGSGGPFILQWKDATFAANGSTTVTYPTSFTSWSRAWNNGARQATNAQDNDPAVISSGTASCSVYSASDSSVSGTIFAIGV